RRPRCLSFVEALQPTWPFRFLLLSLVVGGEKRRGRDGDRRPPCEPRGLSEQNEEIRELEESDRRAARGRSRRLDFRRGTYGRGRGQACGTIGNVDSRQLHVEARQQANLDFIAVERAFALEPCGKQIVGDLSESAFGVGNEDEGDEEESAGDAQ